MGIWIKGRVVGFNGPMATVDPGTVVVRVSQTEPRQGFGKVPEVQAPLKQGQGSQGPQDQPSEPSAASYLIVAGGGGAKIRAMGRIWLPTTPLTHTGVDICEQGAVPVFLSVFR